MADISRAMNTPPPAAQQSPQAPQSRTPAGPDPRFGHDAPDANAKEIARAAKNERDRLRRKAKRAAAAKEAEVAAAKPKKKKAKKKKAATTRLARAQAIVDGKKRRRGRPPGAKNKPKLGLAVALVPTPGVLPRGRAKAMDNSLLAQINSAVLLLNAMPEHARKVVLDAVK